MGCFMGMDTQVSAGREILNMIEERLPGGRYITTSLLVLGSLAAFVALIGFLKDKLVDPLANGLAATTIESSTLIAIAIVLSSLAFLGLAGLAIWLLRKGDALQTQLSRMNLRMDAINNVAKDEISELRDGVKEAKDEIARAETRRLELSKQTGEHTDKLIQLFDKTWDRLDRFDDRIKQLENPPTGRTDLRRLIEPPTG